MQVERQFLQNLPASGKPLRAQDLLPLLASSGASPNQTRPCLGRTHCFQMTRPVCCFFTHPCTHAIQLSDSTFLTTASVWRPNCIYQCGVQSIQVGKRGRFKMKCNGVTQLVLFVAGIPSCAVSATPVQVAHSPSSHRSWTSSKEDGGSQSNLCSQSYLYGRQLAAIGQASGGKAEDAGAGTGDFQRKSATGQADIQAITKSDLAGQSGRRAKRGLWHHRRSSRADRISDAQNDANR